jgi:hypothetical protein
MVAQQVRAAFEGSDTNPATEKEIAAKGNKVNPLDASPATPELSAVFEEHYVEKNVERDPNARSGQGVTRKTKRVERTKIDFR